VGLWYDWTAHLSKSVSGSKAAIDDGQAQRIGITAFLSGLYCPFVIERCCYVCTELLKAYDHSHPIHIHSRISIVILGSANHTNLSVPLIR
jgi:hypothetical protein